MSWEIYKSSTTGQIPGLNALRFFGAISVVFLHLGSYHWFKALGLETSHRLVSGVTGVILFYVISGFLITCLAIDEIKRSGRFDFLKFIQRRSLRLFPLYYLALLSIFIISLLGWTDVPSESWPYAIFYGYNMVPKEAYNSLLGAFHTLATEEQFYLLYGLLLFIAFGLKRVSYLYASLLVAFLLILVVFTNEHVAALFQQYEDSHFLERWLISAVDPLLIGCLTAIIVKSDIFLACLHKVCTNRFTSVLVCSSILLLSIYLFLGYAYGHQSVEWLSVSFSLFIVVLYFFRNTVISKSLEWSPLVYLGTISYGIYVWQAVINGTGPRARWIESPYLSTALVFLVAVISYEYYEKKFLKLKKH